MLLDTTDWDEARDLPAGQLEEDVLERRPLDVELVQDDAVRRCDLADPLGRQPDDERAVARRRDRRALAARAARAAARLRACERASRPPRRRAPRPIVPCSDEPAAVDDHDVVDGLRHLGEHVARDEDRASLGRERAEEVAQPADALRVEPVRRLVEDEHLGIAEQRGGEPEPLPHPERVAA